MIFQKTVLLAGATGLLGSKIAAVLAKKENIQLRALVRSQKVNDEKKQLQLRTLESLGFELVEGDINDRASLERVCTGVNTIVSALSGWEDVVVTGQINLLNAAKRTGVSHFIPSDYTYDYSKLQMGDNYLSDFRIRVAQVIRESGINYTFIMNGIFAEVLFSSFFQVFDFKSNTAEYWGNGDTKFDVTTIEDTAKYTAEAVVDPRAINTNFQVAGDEVTIKEAIATCEKIRGKKLTARSKGSVDDLKAWIEEMKANNTNPFILIPAQYQWGMVSGKVKLHNLVNDRYPHIKPKSIREYLTESEQESFELTFARS
jgi:nucleoside-diphosphate-sugar epimerase